MIFFALLVTTIALGLSGPKMPHFFALLIFLYLFFFVFFENETTKILELDMSFGLAFLCIILILPIFLASKQKMFVQNKYTYLMVIFSFYIIFMFLMGKSYFFTYALYEMSTLPILFLILSGGASKKRGEAGMYLFMFTISSAMILFLILFFICEKGDSLSNSFYQNIFVMQEEKFIISHYFFFFTSLGIVLTFLVKFPSFLLHIWLPKAHVESPVMGSMILAGILLKLGGFGLFIFHKFLLFSSSLSQGLMVSYVLWGAIFLGLFCYRQKDTKILIALSSVNHMALVITGLFLTYSFTFLGSLLIMIGHGLFSSGLFFFSSLNYVKSGNRSTFMNTYGGSKYLGISIITLLLVFLNGGFPPFINFFGEILVMMSMMLNLPLVFLFFLNFFFGGVYAINLMSNLNHKKILKKNSFFFLGHSSMFFSYFIFYLHLVPVFVFFQSWIFF